MITKDLSKLGRNYILTGQYTDIYFPSKGVRYIAVSDGVDSEKGESGIAPFLNILNEMYARQTKVYSPTMLMDTNSLLIGAKGTDAYIKARAV